MYIVRAPHRLRPPFFLLLRLCYNRLHALNIFIRARVRIYPIIAGALTGHKFDHTNIAMEDLILFYICAYKYNGCVAT